MDIFSLINIISDNKIGNKIEKDKQNRVFEELAKIIKNAYTIKDENEIIQILKKGNIREFFAGSFIEGVCYPNLKTICIKTFVIEEVINGEKNSNIIHEAIHLLRSIQNSFKLEKDITGFEEGATEYMTFKALGVLGKRGSNYLLNNKGQKVKCNIPYSCYSECTSLVAQLGIIFGEDKLQEFAFGENNNLLKKLQNTCGKNFYEYFRKTLNKYATDRQFFHEEVLELQSELLERCYSSKFTQIETVEDAVNLFKELQEINMVRAHFDGNTSFKDFYEEKYKQCIEKFGENFEKLEYLKYQEIDLLKVQSIEEIKNNFNKSIRHLICDYPQTNLETSLEIFDNTKRYATVYQDTLYQIAIVKDRIVQFSVGNEKEGTVNPTNTSINNKNEEMYKLRKNPGMPKFDSDFYLKKNKDDNQNYTLIIDGEEVQLTEIDLGVTKEDIESYYSLKNSFVQEKSFKEKFLSFFSKKKTKYLNSPKEKNRSFINVIKETPNNIDVPNKVNQTTTSIELNQER